MSTENAEHLDVTDILIRVAIFGCFIVFGICMWLIRKERHKRERPQGQDFPPSKSHKDQ
jgi:hypothetical protein